MNTGTGNNLGFDLEQEANPFTEALLEFEKNNENNPNPKIGEKVTGKLINKTDRYAIVDFKGKSPVRIDINSQENSILETKELGESIEVIVTDMLPKSHDIIGSAFKVRSYDLQKFLKNVSENEMILTGMVLKTSHAGYDINLNIDGKEHILFMPHLLADMNKLPDPESLIDTEIDFMILENNKDGNISYVASRKHYLQTLVKNEKNKLNKGDVCQGHVTGSNDTAVFVQFNTCLTGMIHKSNLSPEAQELLPNIPSGTLIEFYIKDFIKDKIFLTQVWRDSLWDSISVKDKLNGTISAIKTFGILVDLDYETKGLIQTHNIKSDISMYNVGQVINVKVINVNKDQRQITLIFDK